VRTLSARATTGFWLAVVLAVVDLAGPFIPSPDGEVGPPVEVVLFSAVLGVVTLAAAVVVARTGRRSGLRVMAVSRILSGVTALPAFFVPDVPPVFVAWGAATVVLTIVAVVLLMSRPRVAADTGAQRTPAA
jgi:hypothetical protein